MNRRFFLKLLGIFGFTFGTTKVVEATDNPENLPVVKFFLSKNGEVTINAEELFKDVPWKIENSRKLKEIFVWINEPVLELMNHILTGKMKLQLEACNYFQINYYMFRFLKTEETKYTKFFHIPLFFSFPIFPDGMSDALRGYDI